ncbi:hypothetical protein HZ326_30734 [Fusarium oxysporum f. sp. albedinis]|nr:hypothetical protein HZ326_30734 [Fusarium oxysporum f. sp. albedinis]
MDATVEEILVQRGDSIGATRRSSRPAKPTAKLQEKLQATAKRTRAVNRNSLDQPGEDKNEGGNDFTSTTVGSQMTEDATSNSASLMQIMLRAMLQETSTHLMSEQKKMLERLWNALMENQRTATQMMSDQLEMIRQLQQEIQGIKAQAAEELKKADELRYLHEQTTRQLRVMREQTSEQIRTMREQTARDLEQLREEVMKELGRVQVQTAEEIKQVKEQLHVMADSISSSAQTSPQPSYADVARTPPASQPSNVRTLSSTHATPSALTDTLFCTIDTSRVGEEEKGKAQVEEIRLAIEEEVRARNGRQSWRCAAVMKDARNADRIKVVCRDEAEMQLVREVAEKTVVKGARVLRDQLYPVKVDGANRTAVLDSSGEVLPGAAGALGKENEVTIAKMHWLNDNGNGKTYGSMVVYVTKASDARRLLEERYFHLAGESASTNIFERRQGPAQCYNCWETGHKAFACNKAQQCGRCAETGHRHVDCRGVEPKCTLCGGPHESFSRNCRVRQFHGDVH